MGVRVGLLAVTGVEGSEEIVAGAEPAPAPGTELVDEELERGTGGGGSVAEVGAEDEDGGAVIVVVDDEPGAVVAFCGMEFRGRERGLEDGLVPEGAFPPLRLLALSLRWDCETSRHLRQPSKSINACMQPHSITFRSSQTKFTGWRYTD